MKRVMVRRILRTMAPTASSIFRASECVESSSQRFSQETKCAAGTPHAQIGQFITNVASC
jgi:hypothetical protein